MKKLLLSLIVVLGSAAIANAQVDSRAIGLRLGYGAELSYQHPLGSANRLEVDLGFAQFDHFHLAGVFQWVWDLSALAPGFNWYAGAGAGVGAGKNYTAVGVLGQIGIEFNFNIPLHLSLDWRPGLYFGSGNPAFSGSEIALGIRYKF